MRCMRVTRSRAQSILALHCSQAHLLRRLSELVQAHIATGVPHRHNAGEGAHLAWQGVADQGAELCVSERATETGPCAEHF